MDETVLDDEINAADRAIEDLQTRGRELSLKLARFDGLLEVQSSRIHVLEQELSAHKKHVEDGFAFLSFGLFVSFMISIIYIRKR